MSSVIIELAVEYKSWKERAEQEWGAWVKDNVSTGVQAWMIPPADTSIERFLIELAKEHAIEEKK